jgi:hypothetical protein
MIYGDINESFLRDGVRFNLCNCLTTLTSLKGGRH